MGCNGCSLNNDINDRPAMLGTYDWLQDIPDTSHLSNIVEVRFKGTRKEFFLNDSNLPLKRDELVVVACSPGHDVGVVSLTGRLAELQFKRKIKRPERYPWNKIYRKATPFDVIKWEEAKAREYAVMIRARQIAAELGLDMKIGDVEFRADNNKAIFYYIADDRVDFRELIKRYAREFGIKIEMKQIGVRQEAGRIGGIGSCGRELCCSTWRTDFASVISEAAIRQGISPNAEKMAGRCGKLKCCLMYELDHYLEAQEDFPTELLDLETDKGWAKHFKTDILQKKIWYTYESSVGGAVFALDLEDVKRIINLNKQGKKPSVNKLSEADKPKVNMMNVGEVDQSLFRKNDQGRRKNTNRVVSAKPESGRTKQRRRHKTGNGRSQRTEPRES